MNEKMVVIPEEDISVKFTQETTVRNVRLFGMCLVADEVTISYKIGYVAQTGQHIYREKKEVSKKELRFPLDEITLSDLEALRAANRPSFILKTNGRYFYTPIPRDHLTFYDANILGGTHMCASGNDTCAHLCALPDEGGGCAKIRDKYAHIEDYPWIPKGFEVFGTVDESFVVLHCNHFEKEIWDYKSHAKSLIG